MSQYGNTATMNGPRSAGSAVERPVSQVNAGIEEAVGLIDSACNRVGSIADLLRVNKEKILGQEATLNKDQPEPPQPNPTHALGRLHQNLRFLSRRIDDLERAANGII